MAADEEASSSVPSLGRLSMLLSGMSRKSIHSDTRNNSPSLLCTDDDDESNDNNYTAAEMERKSEDIQRCLSGKSVGDANADESVVDLWHLRALSLSNGGLLNATLRKRCCMCYLINCGHWHMGHGTYCLIHACCSHSIVYVLHGLRSLVHHVLEQDHHAKNKVC